MSLKVKPGVDFVPELVSYLLLANITLCWIMQCNAICWIHVLDDATLPRVFLSSLQFDEQKDQVTVERVLRVIFLDAERPSAVSFLIRFFIWICVQQQILYIFWVWTFWIRRIIYWYNYQALEKLKRQLEEAEAAVEERKKPLPETGPRVVGEGLVIDEWVIIYRYSI